MTEKETPSKPIGLWAMIIVSLILSSAAILLQLTNVLDGRYNGDYLGRGTPEYQQLLTQIQSQRAELATLHNFIYQSNNYQTLRQSLIQSGTPGTTPAARGLNNAQSDSPLSAVMVLEQSQMQNNFDEYQRIQPKDRQDALEQLFVANRELKRLYEQLEGLLSTRFPGQELPEHLVEADSARLGRLLFRNPWRYDVQETIRVSPDKATLRVLLFNPNRNLPGVEKPGDESTKDIEGKMQAVLEGTNWKVSDHPTMVARQTKILASMKKRCTECQALNEKVQKGQVTKWVDFLKAWEALTTLE